MKFWIYEHTPKQDLFNIVRETAYEAVNSDVYRDDERENFIWDTVETYMDELEYFKKEKGYVEDGKEVERAKNIAIWTWDTLRRKENE